MSYATKPNRKSKKQKKANAMTTTTKPSNVTPLPAVYTPVVRPSLVERKLDDMDRTLATKYEGSMLMTTLDTMLSMKRPHEGFNEKNALGYILLNIPSDAVWTFDDVGNLHVDYRLTAANRTLFTAHVDTVHHDDGPNKIRKTDSVWFADGSQLGADDGSGIALLMHMMTNEVRAYYLFTVGEECGGIGAKFVAKRNAALLSQFDRAVAFDRRGTTDVITHQGYGRCASDDFAEALSDRLNACGMLYMPCDSGVYTDTAEFTKIIPECTNISVGYAREHSSEEAQDILHYRALADAVISFSWDDLPVTRDPKAADPDDIFSANKWYYAGKHDHKHDDKHDDKHDADAYAWPDADGYDRYSDKEWARFVEDEDKMYEAIDALTLAREGAYADLIPLIAQAILPDDIDGALYFVRQHIHGMNTDMADTCIDSLYAGHDVDTVLCELYDTLSN
jgi:hypothetical protein